MDAREQFLVLIGLINTALLLVVIAMLLLYKRRDGKIDDHIERVYRHVTGLPQGDIGTVIEAIGASRAETADASEGIRHQISSNQDINEVTLDHQTSKLEWIKLRIEALFK
jgi:hypothetical protein